MNLDPIALIDSCVSREKLPREMGSSLQQFCMSYYEAIGSDTNLVHAAKATLCQFITLVCEEVSAPFSFDNYHQAIRTPVDYYHFGIELIRPLIDFSTSHNFNCENVSSIVRHLENHENVILFSNHQIEPDPQIISLMLENHYPKLAEEMIFVAGHRVTSDPMAVPFSKGRNLLCIFSKKHIDVPIELKESKLLHNKKTLAAMSSLLSEGGKCIYVAPSGGRDRINTFGEVEMAPFDPQSIELFWLIARQAARPTHFYPLALSTYQVLPPPSGVHQQIGEKRYAQRSSVTLSFGEEIDMEGLVPNEPLSKSEKRKVRAEAIWKRVHDDYRRSINSLHTHKM